MLSHTTTYLLIKHNALVILPYTFGNIPINICASYFISEEQVSLQMHIKNDLSAVEKSFLDENASI